MLGDLLEQAIHSLIQGDGTNLKAVSDRIAAIAISFQLACKKPCPKAFTVDAGNPPFAAYSEIVYRTHLFQALLRRYTRFQRLRQHIATSRSDLVSGPEPMESSWY